MANRKIDPNKIKIGDVVLMATGTMATIKIQQKYGYGKSSKWTHVAGSIGGYDLVEGQVPKSRTCSLQENYVDKGIEVRVLRKKSWDNYEKDRVKVALWWATMNNTPYDFPQLMNFLVGLRFGIYLETHNLFNSHKKLICSELIVEGFFKQGYNLFNKPAWNVLPADYDNIKIFDIVNDIWE
ncbi:MAG: hypothetical protein ABIH85_03685 [Candidatus Omnitrophota bacterium]